MCGYALYLLVYDIIAKLSWCIAWDLKKAPFLSTKPKLSIPQTLISTHTAGVPLPQYSLPALFFCWICLGCRCSLGKLCGDEIALISHSDEFPGGPTGSFRKGLIKEAELKPSSGAIVFSTGRSEEGQIDSEGIFLRNGTTAKQRNYF